MCPMSRPRTQDQVRARPTGGEVQTLPNPGAGLGGRAPGGPGGWGRSRGRAGPLRPGSQVLPEPMRERLSFQATLGASPSGAPRPRSPGQSGKEGAFQASEGRPRRIYSPRFGGAPPQPAPSLGEELSGCQAEEPGDPRRSPGSAGGNVTAAPRPELGRQVAAKRRHRPSSAAGSSSPGTICGQVFSVPTLSDELRANTSVLRGHCDSPSQLPGAQTPRPGGLQAPVALRTDVPVHCKQETGAPHRLLRGRRVRRPFHPDRAWRLAHTPHHVDAPGNVLSQRGKPDTEDHGACLPLCTRCSE
nr:translation initiation factor IF-2-like isoform X3 [Bubalus bubalis]